MEAVTKTTKTIEEIIGGAYCPLPINVIPNNIGINLVSVESISWTKQEDGQLVSLTINFLPNTLTTMEKKQTAVDTYFGRYKWYRKLVGSFWYKHQFTKDANELTFTAGGTWWARYNQCNRYSEVIEIETYGGNNE